MKCDKCNIKMEVSKEVDPNGISFNFHRCNKCGEGWLDMQQLKEAADKYRALRKYSVKISKWGNSRGIRFPKELEKEFGLEKKKEVFLIPDKDSIRITVQ